MNLLENIDAAIKLYNELNWTTTNIDRLLIAQRKISYLRYQLGVQTGIEKEAWIKAELAYKNTSYNVELEHVGNGETSNAAMQKSKRDKRVKDARITMHNAKAIHGKYAAIFSSIDSTLASMSQLIKYLDNEKRYEQNRV